METLFIVLIGYVVTLSVVTLFVFGFDKYRSAAGGRRVSERTLLLFSLFGGTIGALIGISLFRHKTRKVSFRLWFYGVVFVQVVSLVAWLYVTGLLESCDCFSF